MLRCKFQQSDKCCLCGEIETTTHLFLCNDESRKSWRRRLIKALRYRLQGMCTKKGITETLCSSITDWLDTGKVLTGKYDRKYHRAIITQSHIGWMHIFMGHFSQEWEILQGSIRLENGNVRSAYIWGASVVELCLRHSIKLWEQRNLDVHGHTKSDREKLLVSKHSAEIDRLGGLQSQARPSDNFLFQGIPELTESSNSNNMAQWIASRRPAIYNSIAMAKKGATDNTHSLTHWFRPIKAPATAKQRLQRWTRNKLVYDPFSKKKRRKRVESCQPKLTHFLSLRSIL